VPVSVPPETRKPFMLEVDDAQVTSRLNTVLYQVTGDTGGRVDATTAPAVLTFEYQDKAGLQVRKEFRFKPDTYLVTFDAQVATGAQTLNPIVHWGPGLGDIGAATAGGSFFTGNYVQPPGAIYHQDGDVERVTAATVAEDR